MTTPDHIMPPITDHGPLETMARAFHNADAQHFAIAYAGPIPDYYTARAEAAITALREAGYAIVPREPTEAILKASLDCEPPILDFGADGYDPFMAHIYRAMIAAATPIDSEKGE